MSATTKQPWHTDPRPQPVIVFQKALGRLAHALENSARVQTKELAWLKSHRELVTTNDLKKLEKKIMAAIVTFLARQKAFNDRQAAAVDGLVESQAGLTEDVAALNTKIEELQNSAGEVTAEDQALIDELETQGEALTAKLEAASTALTALDAATPPKVPEAEA